jgi:hypothetical protein
MLVFEILDLIFELLSDRGPSVFLVAFSALAAALGLGIVGRIVGVQRG